MTDTKEMVDGGELHLCWLGLFLASHRLPGGEAFPPVDCHLFQNVLRWKHLSLYSVVLFLRRFHKNQAPVKRMQLPKPGIGLFFYCL